MYSYRCIMTGRKRTYRRCLGYSSSCRSYPGPRAQIKVTRMGAGNVFSGSYSLLEHRDH